jgi:hypothetical protein
VKKKKKDRKPKPEEKKNMTQQEEQEERSAQEEDAIVAAFANESESEESEDAEKERQEVVEVIDMAAEMSNEAADQGQQMEEAAEEIRDEAVEMKADGTLAEGQQCDVPPAAEVGIRPEEVEVELANSGLQGTEQPSKWKSDALVVADPFILAKVCELLILCLRIQTTHRHRRTSVGMLEEATLIGLKRSVEDQFNCLVGGRTWRV